MKITENNIIESLKSGEEQAFRYIYDKYYGYLCAIAKGYLSDNDAAETVVGDVIYNIWEIRKNLNIHTSLRSYLIRSVKNRSINYLQQEYIAKEISIEEEHPLEKMLETELEKTIKSAIHTLPEECRTAFILSRYHDMKYEEIASQMNISVNTVKYHIKNALSKLRTELKDYLVVLLLFLLSNELYCNTIKKLLDLLNT